MTTRRRRTTRTIEEAHCILFRLYFIEINRGQNCGIIQNIKTLTSKALFLFLYYRLPLPNPRDVF